MAIVLLYHRVNATPSDPWALNVSPEHFAEQLVVLQRWCRVVPLTDLVSNVRGGKSSKGELALTFDDGYADNLHNALPLLERFEAPATLFVPSGHVGSGREFWWDELDGSLLQPGELPPHLRVDIQGERVERELADASRYSVRDAEQHSQRVAWDAAPTARHALYAELWSRCRGLSGPARSELLRQLNEWAGRSPVIRDTHRIMTAAELSDSASFPGVTIGAHTVSHPQLSALPLEDQRSEIASAKRALEQTFVGRVDTFAYPFGKRSDYTRETMDIVRDAGFVVGCINEPGRVTPATPALEVPRLLVRDLSGAAFESWLLENMSLPEALIT